jgi:hypothetical protein
MSGCFVLLSMLALGLSGCISANTALISGQTRADFVLKRDTYLQIRIFEWGCAGTKYGRGVIKYADPEIQDTTVIEAPITPDGSWKESWKVKRSGGVTATYTVTFRPSPQGGTDFAIKFPPEILP